MNKIASVLPAELKDILEDTSLLIGPGKEPATDKVDMSVVRQAIRDEKILAIEYRDLKGKPSQRRIWPFALGYFDEVRVLVAWCELRQEICNFRTDRILSSELIHTRYATPRHVLLKQWRATLNEPKVFLIQHMLLGHFIRYAFTFCGRQNDVFQPKSTRVVCSILMPL